MEQVLLVFQVIVTVGLIGMVLLQRSESDGFGLGSGSGANLLSGRASANLMTRTTAVLAALFILNSLALSVIAAHNRPSSIVESIKAEEDATKPEVAPAKPEAKKETAPEVKDSKPAVPTEGATAPAAPAKKAVKKAEPKEAPADEE